ncbi:hypothetical protein CBS101457_004118 [Exobasidium rhododendri]|nr:hypothetical protein CBS101457_004118 [Exobasidium rhododendri]
MPPVEVQSNEGAPKCASPGLQPNYEVNRPTRVLPDQEGLTSCTITVATKSFANSYGTPLVVEYSPSMLDSSCNDPSKWLFIELSLSGNTSGRQFDRLGSVQLDGVEVLRTDNPEPTQAGVQWSFTKEMNRYYDLWRTDRTVVFDFPNIVNDVYTGILNTTLSFTVYVSTSAGKSNVSPLSASYARIFPLSKRNSTENSFFNVGENGGDDGITQLKLPNNAKAAFVEVYASGTAQDEFWYTDVPDTFYDSISQEASQVGLYPRGPLREIQVLVDDKLAGVAQPFPVVFTGGISPYLWRPQVAFGAYDQPTYLIDISPFLGSLSDDSEHQFQLKVVSAERNQSVLSWFISGNIQVYLDSTSIRTTGSINAYDAPAAGDYVTTGAVDPSFNQTGKLEFEVRGPRVISIQSTLQPGSSAVPYTVSWKQNLHYSNTNNLTSSTASTVQTASGQSTSLHASDIVYSEEFSYPFTTTSQGSLYTVDHEFEQTIEFGMPLSFKEASNQHTSMHQRGEATMIFNNQGQLTSGNGTTNTEYLYNDSNDFSFTRSSFTNNGTVLSDSVGGNLKDKAAKVYA